MATCGDQDAPNHLPSKDWPPSSRPRAPANRSHVINATERQAIEIGEKYLEKEARRLGVHLNKVTKLEFERVAERLRQDRGSAPDWDSESSPPARSYKCRARPVCEMEPSMLRSSETPSAPPALPRAASRPRRRHQS